MNAGDSAVGGASGGSHAAAWLELDRCAQRHVDPYAVWALHTDFRAFARHGELSSTLDFLVELNSPLDATAQPWPGLNAQVPPLYGKAAPGRLAQARHVSVRLNLADRREARAAAAALMLDGAVHRAQIGVPRPALASVDADTALLRLTGAPLWQGRPQVVLGVLEDACPFAHVSLRTGSHETRVVALWDQSATEAASAEHPSFDLGYGCERNGRQLNALMSRHRRDGRVDEERVYAEPAARQQRLLKSFSSHAAAVLTLMAGRQDLLPAMPQQVDSRTVDGIGSAPVDTDAAAAAPILVVQLPREQIDIAGSRWFAVRALDGLRYIVDRSRQLAPGGAPLPLVVNVSYGSIAGAHDGTGMLESAIQELVDLRGAMTVVLAAGNAAGGVQPGAGQDPLARQPRGYHAQTSALAPGTQAALQVCVPPEKSSETYVEIWFEPTGARGESVRGEQFLGARDVTIEVLSPQGECLTIDHLPATRFDASEASDITCGLLGFPRVAQSTLSSMALLVIGPTRIDGPDKASCAGHWTVRVHNRSTRSLGVQAWVERELIPGTGRPVQGARLMRGPAGEPSFELSDVNTLNNIATGERVCRAGAAMALGRADRPTASPYSSSPAPSSRPIEFFAIADESPASPGIRVSGNVSGSVTRMNGSSVAAPQVTRWLANQLSAGLSMERILPRQQVKGVYTTGFGQMVFMNGKRFGSVAQTEDPG